ncbi:GNAT family N-acetyltransferase [Microbispora sp. RL4-1S]|uniref:GNAT family N-acetyltransferase n=1 Tax=Microbispora oryzae TaxID=2806554 RepID=A0A940WIG9_9ACTN|nr:GNAT family N-acetyltransferase [Microbispora oryzae]MBP2706126.1 GNAT family N-acetyltransferase [Microbispora oryzae]
MAWHITDRPDVFHAEAGAFVASRPDLHTMLLSGLDTIERLRSGSAMPPAVLGWWRDQGENRTTAAFVWMPPHILAASRLSGAACTDLAQLLSAGDHPFRGLMADDATIGLFSQAWKTATGSTLESRLHLRLYRLEQVVSPSLAVPGKSRVATAGDRDLLHAWCTSFIAEAGPLGVDLDTFIDERIARHGWRLWEVGGEVVAMAATTPAVAGMARITPVYTSPDHRGQGYGAAVTMAVSRAAQESGAAHVLLFTDVSNPTSNRLYQRIGYQPVSDYRIVQV